MENQLKTQQYLVIDENGEARVAVQTDEEAELKVLKPYTEVFRDINGKPHIGLKALQKKEVSFFKLNRLKHIIFWQKAAKRKWFPAAILCFGFVLFTGLGYFVNNSVHSQNESTEKKAESNEAVDRQLAQNGQSAGIDIAQVYPFAETENATGKAITQEPGNATPIGRSGGYGSLPAIPQSQPRPNVPLPAIPSNSYVATNNSTGVISDAATEKKAKENTYQSRIAFIGGDGVNFDAQNSNKNK